MTANDEQWDDRLRRAIGSQSEGDIEVSAIVLRRVRNRRRMKAALYAGCIGVFFAGAIFMFSNNTSHAPTTVHRIAPVAKQHPVANSFADVLPPPVEQLDVIGRHHDAYAVMFENWNEEQP